MRLVAKIGGFALALGLAGCGDDQSGSAETTTTGGSESTGMVVMNTAPTVVAEADVAAACAMAGVTRVELHATRVGCVSPPPAPCTLPQPPRPTVGEGVDCPSEDSPQTLRVELMQAGRYHVSVAALAGEDVSSSVCFGQDGMVELLVDDEWFAENPTIPVTVLDGSPCS